MKMATVEVEAIPAGLVKSLRLEPGQLVECGFCYEDSDVGQAFVVHVRLDESGMVGTDSAVLTTLFCSECGDKFKLWLARTAEDMADVWGGQSQ